MSDDNLIEDHCEYCEQYESECECPTARIRELETLLEEAEAERYEATEKWKHYKKEAEEADYVCRATGDKLAAVKEQRDSALAELAELTEHPLVKCLTNVWVSYCYNPMPVVSAIFADELPARRYAMTKAENVASVELGAEVSEAVK